MSAWLESREALFDAADLAVGVLASEAVDRRWDEPSAVEGFSVGGLAAHISATVRFLEVALDEPMPDSPNEVSLVGFYGANRIDGEEDRQQDLHVLIRGHAEDRARHGAESVHGRFVKLVSRLRDRLEGAPPDRLVPVLRVPAGVTSLETYVKTRVVELAVHSDDLATSVGLPDVLIPPAAAKVVIDVCVELARARTSDLEVIRALTRAERATPDTLRVL